MKNGLLKITGICIAVLATSWLAAHLWFIDPHDEMATVLELDAVPGPNGSHSGNFDPSSPESSAPIHHVSSDREIEYATSVEFPDGTEVPVKWQVMPTPDWIEKPPFADDYPLLSIEAENGDPAAAFRLWQILSRCEKAYDTETQLTNAMNIMQERHQVQLPGMEAPAYIASEDTRGVMRTMLEQLFRDCEGITREQKQERSRWLEDAAFAEYPVAMMEYSSITPDYETGLAIDKVRWEKGDAHALQSLADRYWQTYLSGSHPENKILSFAHLYAYTLVGEIRFERGSGTPDARLDSIRSKLHEVTGQMNPAELDEAIDLAKSLLVDSSTCCFRF